MSTIKDVARVAGVSIATVSRVVNNGPKVGEKTRERVLKVMEQLGYTPNANARALVTQKSATLGVVIPDLTDPFFASLAHGVEQVARANNQQMLLSTGQLTAQSELQAINLLIEQQCETIVVHSKKLSDAELVELSDRIQGLVFIDRLVPGKEEKCVWLENIEGGRIAARHLLALDHKEFAVITSSYQIDDPALRFQGFEQTVMDAGFQLPKQLVVANEPNLKGGELAAQELLSKKAPFTALFVYNDAMAIGAISVLEDNGYKVPDDVAVIGFDDVLLSKYSRPKLTTLHYPIKEMAENAANLAIACNQKTQRQVDFQHKYLPRLVKRESAGRRK